MTNTPNAKSNLLDLLFIFKRDMLEKFKKDKIGHDLTFQQVEVVRFIVLTGKETMKNIADFLKVTPPSATEIVAEMEKKGLVKRQSDKNDRRIVFISLTKTAKKLSTLACKRRELILNKMLSKLDKKDCESLERIIRIIITN